MGTFGLGLDEVGHGFSLREVHFAVKEGALGELSGMGHAATVRQQHLHDLLLDKDRSVAGNLHHVLASVGVRCGKLGYDNLVNELSVFNYLRKLGALGREGDDVCLRK